VPLPVIVGAVVYVIGGVLLVRTVGGLRTYAIGGSPDAVRLIGIDPDRYVTGLYVLTGLLTALASVMPWPASTRPTRTPPSASTCRCSRL
jgi:ribose/xylose/arabinose/galactoside ABC-type transport system permease subunit